MIRCSAKIQPLGNFGAEEVNEDVCMQAPG